MEGFCGLDVHKDSAFVRILTDSGEKFEEKFGTLTSELERLRQQLRHYNRKIIYQNRNMYRAEQGIDLILVV